MTLEERRTHMWQAIVRRVFSFEDQKRSAEWLGCFTQSVFTYIDDPIGLSPKLSCDTFRGRFGHGCLLTCDYTIGSDRAQFDIQRPEWYAQYGIDRTVFAPLRGADEEVDEVTAGDVDSVLRGMIAHPRVHLHTYEDKVYHDMRIGSGLDEPLLFLFQLRFQLNLDEKRREAEIARLRDIFTPDWFKQRNSVTPSYLFDLR